MKVTLEVSSNKAKVRRVVLEEDAIVGRGSDCSLRVKSNDVSRQHCVIRLLDDGVAICDLGSSNGTFLNGKPLPANSDVMVESGAEISVGPLRFTVVHDGQSPVESAPAAVASIAETDEVTPDELDAVVDALSDDDDLDIQATDEDQDEADDSPFIGFEDDDDDEVDPASLSSIDGIEIGPLEHAVEETDGVLIDADDSGEDVEEEPDEVEIEAEADEAFDVELDDEVDEPVEAAATAPQRSPAAAIAAEDDDDVELEEAEVEAEVDDEPKVAPTKGGLKSLLGRFGRKKKVTDAAEETAEVQAPDDVEVEEDVEAEADVEVEADADEAVAEDEEVDAEDGEEYEYEEVEVDEEEDAAFGFLGDGEEEDGEEEQDEDLGDFLNQLG